MAKHRSLLANLNFAQKSENNSLFMRLSKGDITFSTCRVSFRTVEQFSLQQSINQHRFSRTESTCTHNLKLRRNCLLQRSWYRGNILLSQRRFLTQQLQ